jgi:hypothetical protein
MPMRVIRNGRWRLATKKPDPLAFDLGALLELVTPAAMLMATALAQSLADGLLPPDAVADSRRRLVRWSRRALRRPVPDPADAAALDQPAAAPDLTDEQLAQVKEGVVRTAVAAGVPDVKAQLIADALIGRLISMRGDPES